MFEGVLLFYLNKYLGQYLDGIDAQSLRYDVLLCAVIMAPIPIAPAYFRVDCPSLPAMWNFTISSSNQMLCLTLDFQ